MSKINKSYSNKDNNLQNSTYIMNSTIINSNAYKLKTDDDIKYQLASLLNKLIELLKIIDYQKQSLNNNPEFELYSFLKTLKLSLTLNKDIFSFNDNKNKYYDYLTKANIFDYLHKEKITSTYNAINSCYYLNKTVVEQFFLFFDSNKNNLIDYNEFITLTLTELDKVLRSQTTQRQIKNISEKDFNICNKYQSSFNDFKDLIKLEIEFSQVYIDLIKEFLRKYNIDVYGIMHIMDYNDKGFIDYLDLFSFIQFYYYHLKTDEVYLLFNRLDINKDGKISLTDLEQCLFFVDFNKYKNHCYSDDVVEKKHLSDDQFIMDKNSIMNTYMEKNANYSNKQNIDIEVEVNDENRLYNSMHNILNKFSVNDIKSDRNSINYNDNYNYINKSNSTANYNKNINSNYSFNDIYDRNIEEKRFMKEMESKYFRKPRNTQEEINLLREPNLYDFSEDIKLLGQNNINNSEKEECMSGYKANSSNVTFYSINKDNNVNNNSNNNNYNGNVSKFNYIISSNINNNTSKTINNPKTYYNYNDNNNNNDNKVKTELIYSSNQANIRNNSFVPNRKIEELVLEYLVCLISLSSQIEKNKVELFKILFESKNFSLNCIFKILSYSKGYILKRDSKEVLELLDIHSNNKEYFNDTEEYFFNSFDKNCDGRISFGEFVEEMIPIINYTTANIITKGNGNKIIKIRYTEKNTAMNEVKKVNNEEYENNNNDKKGKDSNDIYDDKDNEAFIKELKELVLISTINTKNNKASICLQDISKENKTSNINRNINITGSIMIKDQSNYNNNSITEESSDTSFKLILPYLTNIIRATIYLEKELFMIKKEIKKEHSYNSSLHQFFIKISQYKNSLNPKDLINFLDSMGINLISLYKTNYDVYSKYSFTNVFYNCNTKSNITDDEETAMKEVYLLFTEIIEKKFDYKRDGKIDFDEFITELVGMKE